ncbi:hypothetical protein BGZ76_004069 [Entomortierella beljakovae]|nr:hypothetical protein BGZ76_004069 [Entomortierella beljakovae]
MKDLVFDIPLLKEEVTQYLLPHHLFRCTLVSKQWNYWFSPVLWRAIDLRLFEAKTPKDKPPKLLIQHAEHIRSIFTGSIRYLDSYPIFPNLQTLRVKHFDTKVNEQKIIHIISKSPTLRTIALASGFSTDDQGVQDLLDTLVKLPMLSHLEIAFAVSIQPERIRDVIVANGHLETLHISTNCHSLLDIQIQSIGAAIRGMKVAKIKNLKLEMRHGQPEAGFTIPLVERCDRLESLHIITHMQSDMKQIANALKDKKNTLKSFQYRSNAINTECFDELLVTLGTTNNNIGDMGLINSNGIEELILHRSPQLPKPFPRILASHHSRLTSLEYGSLLPIVSLMTILNELSMLKSFKGSYHGYEVTDEELNEAYKLPWNCVNMQTFHTTLGYIHRMTGQQYHRSWKGSNDDKAVKLFFSQIGRLNKLEELKVGATAHCLTQRHGYLEQLSGLKELGILDLGSYTHQKSAPSPVNVEWMMDHWPKWHTVHFCGTFVSNWSPISTWRNRNRKPRNSTIDAILKRRPQMTITIGGRDILAFR